DWPSFTSSPASATPNYCTEPPRLRTTFSKRHVTPATESSAPPDRQQPGTATTALPTESPGWAPSCSTHHSPLTALGIGSPRSRPAGPCRPTPPSITRPRAAPPATAATHCQPPTGATDPPASAPS